MSVLIIYDAKSQEQVEKLEKLGSLIKKDYLSVSGYNIAEKQISGYNYIANTTDEYIEKILISEVVFLLSEKANYMKFNRSQIFISWFDRHIMEHSFNKTEATNRVKLINKYKLGAIIGVKNKNQLVDSYRENEYAETIRYLRYKKYSLNVFLFNSDIHQEDKLMKSKELREFLSNKNSVNLVLNSKGYSRFLLSKFDYALNTNHRMISYLQKRFGIKNLKQINPRKVNLINDKGSFFIKDTLSKAKPYFKYLKKQSKHQKSPLVSIIIPHYNTEPTLLYRAIDSATNNRYKNIEVIIVDDGSKIKLKDELEKFYRADGRVRVTEKENEGLGLARNTGVKNARGKYVFFVDSDDTITTDGLFYLVAHAELHKLKMVSGKVSIVDEYGIPMNLSLDRLFNDSYLTYFPQDTHKILMAQMAHGKLLRRDIFEEDEIWFKQGLYEDGPWSMQLYTKLNRHDFLNTVSNHWYRYKSRETISTTASLSNMKERYRSFLETIEHCDQINIFHKTNFWFFQESTMYFENYKNFTQTEKKQFFSLMLEFIKIYGNYLDIEIDKSRKVLVQALFAEDFEKFDSLLALLYEQKVSDFDNYVVSTRYHLSIAMLYAAKNKKHARLYLQQTNPAEFSNEMIKEVRRTDLFSQVVVFEDKESGRLIELLSKDPENAKYTIPNILYRKYLNIFKAIASTERIYIFNVRSPFWYYLKRTYHYFIKLEDEYLSFEKELSLPMTEGQLGGAVAEYVPELYPDASFNSFQEIIVSKLSSKPPEELKGKITVGDTKVLQNKYKALYSPIKDSDFISKQAVQSKDEIIKSLQKNIKLKDKTIQDFQKDLKQTNSHIHTIFNKINYLICTSGKAHPIKKYKAYKEMINVFHSIKSSYKK